MLVVGTVSVSQNGNELAASPRHCPGTTWPHFIAGFMVAYSGDDYNSRRLESIKSTGPKGHRSAPALLKEN